VKVLFQIEKHIKVYLSVKELKALPYTTKISYIGPTIYKPHTQHDF